ncbi:MAG TPA: glycosyl hydrolase [Blastocatellia bacterium]|nr:glycosyl hydrolase [Blastocatellia bacterium]
MRAPSPRIALLVSLVASIGAAAAHAQTIKLDSNSFGGIEARHIGPAVTSGRIAAVDGVNSDPRIIYVGSAGGGVWKSINAGTSFKPIFDKYTQSIGAVTVDQAHPDTVWVGTGESWTRNSVSVGTGLYKTTDAGESWKLMGLEDSERIARIVIDPRNSDVVYVAVTGHLWNSNDQRGVYKTIDGGKTWNRMLFVNTEAGCADIAIDPQEPSIVYASMWQFRRKPYYFTSGGPGSGLYKSTDAGKTWKKLTNGLPEGELGRIAIGVAPSRPNRVYAVVEAKKSGVYRSDDMGETWTRVSAAQSAVGRPFYFARIVVDPKDYNRLYKPDYSLSVSTDGGQSFTSRGGRAHGDFHDAWVNPQDTFNLFVATDGGVYVSRDKANAFKFLSNLPVGQFYHVGFDMEQPYNVYGGLQDNGSWMGPSQSPNGIENKDWRSVGFGDGFHVYPDPTDRDVLYSEFQGGSVLRFHKSTGETKLVKVFPKQDEPKYRFNWNTAMHLSPTNPKVLYIGGQFLFRSTNKGESFERISPDLTTNDPAKQKQDESGGLSLDNSSAENHCTIFTIAESPLDEKVIWVGTDDGNLQLTRDSGKSWTNVVRNIPGLPANTWCNGVEASRFDKATAYAVFDGHQTGDMKVYVYKTTDFGKTWKSIATDAIKGYAHVIREDRVNRDLLFVGTEFGLFVSIDGGTQWAQFTGNVPPVAVRDIAIHPREHDLILATHGRGILIIDDITPLRQLSPKILESAAYVMESRPSPVTVPVGAQDFPGDGDFVGSNPSEAATITYYLKDRHVFGDLKIEVYNSDGKLMSTLPAGKRKGINRVQWFMRSKPPKVPPSPNLAGPSLTGLMVPEGVYTVKLIKDKETFTGQVRVVADPKSPHSAADRALQAQTLRKLFDMQERLAFVDDVVTNARDQAKERAKKVEGDALAKELDAFADKLEALHKTLVATREGPITGEEQLRERIVELYGWVTQYGGRPTESQLARIPVLEKEIDSANSQFETIVGKDLNAVNANLAAKKLEPIKVLIREEWDKKQQDK